MKTKIVIVLCLVAALLCACSGGEAVPIETRKVYTEEKTIVNEKYTIYQEEGTWFMEFPAEETENPAENAPKKSKDPICGVAPPYPEFASVYDMQEQIIEGTIQDSDLVRLKRESKNGKLEICNPYDLQYLHLPDDMVLGHVWWEGDSYGISFYGDVGRGSVECYDEETFNQQFEDYNADAIKYEFPVISDKTVPDRNAREVHYKTGVAELRNVFYELKIGRASLFVVEHYAIKYFSNRNSETSNTVPSRVKLYWNDGEYYYVGIVWVTERPSVEWLRSFRLVPVA